MTMGLRLVRRALPVAAMMALVLVLLAVMALVLVLQVMVEVRLVMEKMKLVMTSKRAAAALPSCSFVL